MPTFELSLVVKQALKRPDMVAAVKRTGESVINNGGYIRNLEFLGHRHLPQRQKANGEYHTKGSYFVMKIDIPNSGEILNNSAVTAPFHDPSIEKFSAKKLIRLIKRSIENLNFCIEIDCLYKIKSQQIIFLNKKQRV